MTTQDQALNQTQDSTKDRSATITVTPTLVWHSTNPPNITATLEYAVSDCDPANTATVDTSSGSINISHMPATAGYNENIDFALVLDTSNMKDASGNLLTGNDTPRWAHGDEGPTYTDSKGKTQHLGYGWFCKINNLGPPLNYDISPPITIDKMDFKRKTDTKLMIDDDTPDGSPVYCYMMAFVLPGANNNYYISIDPVISGKGTQTTNFMLKK
jgi:hypothetical protein